MQKIEILAPAGSPEHLIPALRCGADAVYIGLETMNARVNAGNFSPEALRDAVFACHARDVKVYLTLNTLVKDREMEKALDAVSLACDAKVDALIVQDLGLAALIRRAAPDMPLHASTQMSVHTPRGAALLYEQGFRRVVLARECSEAEICAIQEACPVELEVFVHGALCMSVSGQCYLSAMLGSRSGNRGQCAQPCRLPFSAGAGQEYALSLKDNSLIDRLPQLQKMGIVSAKIEGRMKRPEYVAAAVRACRQMVDKGRMDESLRTQLEAVFSRSGFTSGYFDATRGQEMFGIRAREDVQAATGELLGEIRQTYRDEPGRIPVYFDFWACPGAPARLKAWEKNRPPATVEGEVPEQAESRPLEEERCREQLCKTGGTPFLSAPERVTVTLDGAPALPVSALNRLRREALKTLLANRSERPGVAFSLPDLNKMTESWPRRVSHRGDQVPIRAHFRDVSLPEQARACEICYLPLFTPREILEKRLKEGFTIGVALPRGLFSLEDRVHRALEEAYRAGVRDAYTGNLGGIPLIQEANMRLHGGFGLNLFNGFSLQRLADWGAVDGELSLELSRGEMETMPKPLPAGAVVYGHLPLMLTRNCPVQVTKSACRGCGGLGTLTDRKGMIFPVMCEGACTEILNTVPLEMSDRLNEIKGLQFISMWFTVENPVETEEKLYRYFNQKCPDPGYTRGLWTRGVH